MSGIERSTLSEVGAALVAAVALTACGTETPSAPRPAESTAQARPLTSGTTHPYVGMWVTADNHIRQELLANGRYDEARGRRDSAYTGRYEVTGDHIDYWDDSGFTADGRFEGDVLHHGGYLFYREGSAAHRRAVATRG
ncbi:Atu4866 domain-containing protein [Micromonospora echinospora]|uniref:Atu4866 domain-containing protein n=1 Tax=Micromonospora echinospora TaxID=1877 RepID=UPI00340D36E9